LSRSNLAPNLLMADGVTLAEDVEIGANVVLRDGVSIGPGARIDDGVVLGRVPTLGRRSRTATPTPGATTIEAGAIICPYAVVDVGAQVGCHAFVGDRVSVRSGVRLHADASIGGASFVGRDAEVGERVRTQNGCVLGPGVRVEPDSFLGPAVQVLTGRPMDGSARKGPPILRRGCQIGAGALVMPGVEIGEDAVVGAGAVVLADVPAGTTVVGMPARARILEVLAEVGYGAASG
jgi:UDP-2-acetamido-3-amino-2,3-dideoxy-glucuronate N-acetyltransferase